MTDKTTDTARTADSADTTEQTIIDDTIISPGSLTRALKKCREGADMDVKQAAGEMRLPLGVLKALEAEEFDDLPEPPYIRGYLRSYARLNESDPNELIRRYEILRGADPNDVPAFAPATPLQRTTNKPAVSPSTVKLAGLALMVLVLGVLSMIPAVSQWATETWRSFSEPTAEQQLASADGIVQNTQQNAMSNTGTGDTNTNSTNQADNASGSSASSSNDTATSSGTSEQLAPNNQDSDSSANSSSNSDTTGGSQQSDSDNAGDSNDSSNTNTTDTAGNGSTGGSTQTTNNSESGDNNNGANDGSGNTTTNEDPESTEAIAAKLAEEEKAKKLAEEEAVRKAEEEEARKLAEAEAAKLAEEEAKKLAEEEAAKKAEEEAKKLAEAEAAKKAEKEKKDNFKQPMEGNVAIRLVFSSNVWMSIKDAKNKNIFAALSGPGTRRNLTGRTPLRFRVGNAPGVKIYLNGQLVDQRPYTKGSVSEFSVN